jgi:hypothetical protein
MDNDVASGYLVALTEMDVKAYRASISLFKYRRKGREAFD